MTLTAKPRRRFFQFSLSGLLVFVAVICVFLAARTNRLQQRRAAIAEIEKLGGAFANLSSWNRGWFISDADVPKMGLLARLLGDEPSTYVMAVFLDDPSSNVTDADLACLLPLREIQAIVISKNSVTDAGLLSLTSLPDLSAIDLGNGNVTDAGIARFQAALPNCVIER